MGSADTDAAVDFQPLLRAQFMPEEFYLLQHLGHEGLAGEAGFDAHDENQIGDGHDGGEGFHGGAGLEAYAGGAAEVVDAFDQIDGILAGHGFDVKGQILAAGLAEGGDVVDGIADHQVHIHHQATGAGEGFDDVGPHGEVGHKVAIHDVHVQKIGPRALDVGGLTGELAEIGGQDRRARSAGGGAGDGIRCLPLRLPVSPLL